MKAEIIEKECEKKIMYPCLMKTELGLIVLFIKEEVGTVIIGDENWTSGEFNNEWIMNDFRKFEGRLILEND